MKKLLGLFLIALFVISIIFTISNNVKISNSENKTGYASILPIPPPEPPARRGC